MEVLFEDPHLIVLSKPAGLLSQGESAGDPNVVDLLRERFFSLKRKADREWTG